LELSMIGRGIILTKWGELYLYKDFDVNLMAYKDRWGHVDKIGKKWKKKTTKKKEHKTENGKFWWASN